MEAEQKKQLEKHVEELFREKFAAGRDYAFMQQKGNETRYSDQYYNDLVHFMRANGDGCYLLELEQTKGEKCEYTLNVYHINGSGRTMVMSRSFKGNEGDGKEDDASDIFGRFRDTKDIKAELEKYEKALREGIR